VRRHPAAPRTRSLGIAVALALAAGAAACSGSAQNVPRTRLSAKQIVERSKPAIVRIESAFEGGNRGVGTGFAVRGDGLIATNLHVINGAAAIRVTLLDGSDHAVTSVVGVDPDRDLALIQIDHAAGVTMPTLTIGDSDAVAAGDPVIAIGNPLGVLDYSVSDGLISSVRPVSPTLTVLQISAPISQGSSGGPLFNGYGEVIGIATAIFTEGQNLNFGVPSKYLRQLVAAPKPMSLSEFAERTQAEPVAGKGTPGGSPPKIERRIPQHDLSILDGCEPDMLAEVFQAIQSAIELGAPLYNDGNHEACYRVYEGAAVKYEQSAGCPGIRTAFGNGLLRASTLNTYTEKAWALRDTFDGLLLVIMRKVQGQGGGQGHGP
jgi:hypothetical protein